MIELASSVASVVVTCSVLAIGLTLVVGLLHVILKITLFPLTMIGGALKILFLFLPLLVLVVAPSLPVAVLMIVSCFVVCWWLVALF